MRSVRAGASGSGTLVIVVAIGAVHATAGGPGSQQTGHGGIAANGFDGMEGGVGGMELEAGVGLNELAVHFGGAARDAVGVATIAELVFIGHAVNGGAAGVKA